MPKAHVGDMSHGEAKTLLVYLSTAPGSPEEASARVALVQELRAAGDDADEHAVNELAREAMRAGWPRNPDRR